MTAARNLAMLEVPLGEVAMYAHRRDQILKEESMRAGIWIVLVLTLLVIGAGIFVFAVFGLTPATIANASILPTGSANNSAAGSVMAAPPAQSSGATDLVSGNDANAESATFAPSTQGHQCDRDTSASAGD